MIDPRFDLIDHDGRRVDETAFSGRFTLVFFGLTKCPVVCPRALTKISDALELVDDLGEGINALYITVDPEADTPQAMRAFIRAWPRFRGLTGSRAEIDAAKMAFHVFSAREDEAKGEYRVRHSAFTYLLGPSGQHVAHWSEALSAEEVAERLRRCIRPEAAQPTLN